MINIAQIGVGRWGQNLLRNFSNLADCQVKICCDKSKENLGKIRRAYGDTVKVTENFNDLINDKDIDAIVIATLPASHAKFAIKALSKGKHVFVEKPLALDIKDARDMIKASQKHKKILMVGHLLLYHPAIKRIKTYIDDKVLGDVHYIYSARVNLGQVREEENVLWSLAVHDISVAMYLLEKKPISVQAIGKSYIRKGIQDVTFVTLNFKNGVMAHIHASWLDPHKVRKFTIVGSNKMAVFDDMQSNEKLRIYDKGFQWMKNSGTYESFLTLREGDINMPRLDMMEPLKLECQHFVDCINRKKKPFTDGKNGIEVLKVLTAAQKSLKANGKPIKV